MVGVVGRPGQGEELAFLRGSALGFGQGGQSDSFVPAAPGPGRGFMGVAVGVPFDPGSADVDHRCHPVRVAQCVAQRQIGAERMPAYGPALIAEVGPQGVKISNELIQRPRALVPGPAAAALIVTVYPCSRASEAGQWRQVVPQARPAMAQHQRLTPAGDLCPQTASIAHRHQISPWPSAHPPIITGRSSSSQPSWHRSGQSRPDSLHMLGGWGSAD